jgi:hypothetical protein
VGGGWVSEIESFFGPLKWHRADRRVPFVAQMHNLNEKEKKNFPEQISLKSLRYKNISIVTDRYENLSRRRPALPDPESDPKQFIPDPQPCSQL